MPSKIIVLTGGNKGVGRGIAELLLKTTEQPLTLYLTARQPSLGQAAVDEIKALGLLSKSKSELLFHQLDITSESSVKTLADYLKGKHGKIDVLINNAAVAMAQGPKFDLEVASDTVDTNYYGTLRVCTALLPLIDPSEGRLVIVSSRAGSLINLPGEHLRKAFSDPNLTIEKLNELMEKFKADVANGTFEAEGWPKNSYYVSKTGTTALSKILAREHPELIVNACCPGWVKTDMAPQGIKTIEQGAMTPVLLAIGDIKTTGGLWRDEKFLEW